MDLTRKKFSKAAKVSLLLFATLVLSTAYFTPHPAKGTSMSNFPAAHEDFLGAASYEAIFDDATGTADPGPNGPMPIIVGPNVRVNAPQQAPPAGLLGCHRLPPGTFHSCLTITRNSRSLRLWLLNRRRFDMDRRRPPRNIRCHHAFL
jgi:hypothetical protein